jgi:hypothetical protein
MVVDGPCRLGVVHEEGREALLRRQLDAQGDVAVVPQGRDKDPGPENDAGGLGIAGGHGLGEELTPVQQGDATPAVIAVIAARHTGNGDATRGNDSGLEEFAPGLAH